MLIANNQSISTHDNAGDIARDNLDTSNNKKEMHSTNEDDMSPHDSAQSQEHHYAKKNKPNKSKINKIKQAKPSTGMNIDSEMVMKCLNNDVSLQSKYSIALYDFGGQSVFNVIHPFFLTQYGIYLVVFSMEWFYQSKGKFYLSIICFL